MQFSRRNFIKSTIAGIAGASLFNSLSRAESRQIPIAVQVYSVGDAAQKDLAGTLKEIRKIGFRGVEFAGTYGHSAEEVSQFLADAGLVCIGTHLGIGDLLGERFEETVKYNKTIGNPNLIVAGGLGSVLAEDGGNQITAYLFSEIAQKGKQLGCRIGFHAHAGDFTDMGNGQTAWDLFFSRTDPDVIAEMDIGNCLACGGNPYQSMEKAPGRGRLIHLKASKPDGTILGGEGDEADWERAFRICETVAGTEWYIVEQEGSREMSSLDAIAACFENLKRLGKC